METIPREWAPPCQGVISQVADQKSTSFLTFAQANTVNVLLHDKQKILQILLLAVEGEWAIQLHLPGLQRRTRARPQGFPQRRPKHRWWSSTWEGRPRHMHTRSKTKWSLLAAATDNRKHRGASCSSKPVRAPISPRRFATTTGYAYITLFLHVQTFKQFTQTIKLIPFSQLQFTLHATTHTRFSRAWWHIRSHTLLELGQSCINTLRFIWARFTNSKATQHLAYCIRHINT